MPHCPRCDRENDQESSFCKHCGCPLAAPEAGTDDNDDTLIIRLLDERPQDAVARRASVWLLDPSGEHVAQAIELQGEQAVIGRHSDCEISLPSSTVSRRHALIWRAGGRFYLKDLSSTNGTLLNREPVIGEELLHDRDEIGVGVYRLIFRYS
jgi:hypothetical protein